MSLPANLLTDVTPASLMLTNCPSVVTGGVDGWNASASDKPDKISARPTPSCASIWMIDDGTGVSSFLNDPIDFEY